MNKKLVMAGALGLVALGAGVFALGGFGGGPDDAPARQARAETKASSNEDGAGDTADVETNVASLGDGNAVKLADAVSPAPSPDDTSPSTSNGPTGAAPSGSGDDSNTPADGDSADESDGNSDSGAQDTPNIPDGGDLPSDNGGNDEPGSPIIYNEAVADAICELLGCNAPTITPDPDFADGLCELMNCDDEPVTVTPDIKPCQITGNCPPAPIIHKDLGLGTGISMRP